MRRLQSAVAVKPKILDILYGAKYSLFGETLGRNLKERSLISSHLTSPRVTSFAFYLGAS